MSSMDSDEEKKLLIRVDERTMHIMGSIKQLSEIVSADYVSKEEFAPIKSIVYGMVGFILISTLAALVALVIKK